ncbi:MAG: DUF7684 family protein [Nitrospinales bacterium]
MLKYIHIRNGGELPEIGYLKPFKVVVVIEEDVSREWQIQASSWLVNSGCLYMMAWGQNCGTWDDSVDMAVLEKWNFGDIPDEEFVMTTWHESEPLEEVFYYGKNDATHSIVEIKNVLILHIGLTDKEADFKSIYQTA